MEDSPRGADALIAPRYLTFAVLVCLRLELVGTIEVTPRGQEQDQPKATKMPRKAYSWVTPDSSNERTARARQMP